MTVRERFFESQGVSWWIVLLEGIAAVIIGILIISFPEESGNHLLNFLGIFFLIKAGLGIVSIFTDREDWPYKLLMGIIGILLGLFIFLAPLAAFSVIRGTLLLFVGIGAVTLGFVEIARALKGGGCGIAVVGALIILLGLIVLGNLGLPPGAYANLVGGIAIAGGIAIIIMAFGIRSGIDKKPISQ